MKKIVVPEGMLKALRHAVSEPSLPITTCWDPYHVGLEAALRWLGPELAKMFHERLKGYITSSGAYCISIKQFDETCGSLFVNSEPPEDGTVVWWAGTTIPMGVWSQGKFYPIKRNQYENPSTTA